MNNIPQKPYKPLTPFGLFIRHNFPFVEATYEARDNYDLLCKIYQQLKTVEFNQKVSQENIEILYNFLNNLDFQDEVNQKLDEMAQDGTLEALIGDLAFKKVDYFKINNDSTEDDILEAFKTESTKVISFEKGDYVFTNDIVINSNTKILLNGSKLLTNSHNKIIAYENTSTFTAYNGNSNISIENGYNELMIVLMHNTNVNINNIEFGYKLLDHAIQIAGCKNIKINNCTFHGSAISQNGSNQEMIQLETCTYAGQPYLNQDSVSYDHYGNNNIIINNNIFDIGDGLNTQNYTCIGHHSKDSDNEFCNENIIISNNTFNTVRYSAIRPVGFNNCIIENNTFNQTDNISGVIIVRPSWKNKNLTIRNNIFNGGSSAITNVNVEQNENYLIENNKFLMTYAGTTCYLQSLKNSKVINNYFEYQTSAIGTAESNGDMDNLLISNNTFISKLDVASNYAINIFKCTNLVVVNNYCYQISDNAFIFYRGTTDKYPMYYANNYIYNANYNPNDLNGTNIVYNRIYNSLRRLYQAPNSNYSAITNTSVSWNFTEFNKLKLVLARNGNASNIQIVEVAPYELFAKLSANRNYDITSNIDGTLHYGIFSITSDNTFSYSGDGYLTLIGIYGYNELQI